MFINKFIYKHSVCHKTSFVAREKANFISESGIKGRPSHKLQKARKNYPENRIFESTERLVRQMEIRNM